MCIACSLNKLLIVPVNDVEPLIWVEQVQKSCENKEMGKFLYFSVSEANLLWGEGK